MAVIPVALGGRSYDVVVGKGLLPNIMHHADELLRKKNVPIVADMNARAAHGLSLDAALEHAGHDAQWFDVPPGEGSKSWAMLQNLTDWLLAHKVERGDTVIALGGGVVGDLTGFACSMLKRGCGFIQIPTTLLAQVDSSVGGKTAINTAAGKNLIGAFYQPSLVLADIDVLQTLPIRHLRAGYAEVMKYGILGDPGFFDWCESRGGDVIALHPQPLIRAVSRSVEAKARIVAEDEREISGRRALLNLGHTFAHALEAEMHYSDRLLHGEAVALGMVLAARYSQRRGLIKADAVDRIAQALNLAGLGSEISALGLTVTGDHIGRSYAARQEDGCGHAAVHPATRHRQRVRGA